MDDLREEGVKDDDFDPLAPIKDDELEDDDEVLAAGTVPVVPVKKTDEEDVDDIDALIDEEEEGLDDFGAEDYNAPDND
jgi:hypothetical protein